MRSLSKPASAAIKGETVIEMDIGHQRNVGPLLDIGQGLCCPAVRHGHAHYFGAGCAPRG